MRVLLIGVAAALLAAGCGQKGALYLPDKKPSVVTPPQPGAPTQKKSEQDENTQQPQQPQ